MALDRVEPSSVEPLTHDVMAATQTFSIARGLFVWLAVIIGMLLFVGTAVIALNWWQQRPVVVGPRLCRQLVNGVLSGVDGSANRILVSESVRVTPREDGSYRIGMTIHAGDGSGSIPFYCSLTRVNGQWRAMATE